MFASVAVPYRVLGVSTWSSPAQNNNVTIYDNIGNASTQHWRLERHGDAYIFRTSVSHLVMNAFTSAGTAVAGLNVNVWSYVDAVTQRWILLDAGNGQVAIASQGNRDLVLTIADTGNSARISIQPYTGGNHQLWSFHNAYEQELPSSPLPFMAEDEPLPPAPDMSTASEWAHDYITAAIAESIVPTAIQGNYTNITTRAEFAALAVALYETITGEEVTGRLQFNDTNDLNVQKAGYLGVVQGVGGGIYAPDSTLTREQAAVMLSRLAGIAGQPIPAAAPTFADNAQISSWAVDAAGQMQATGIMGGVGNNQFAPKGDYTREQSIITILRLFNELR